MALEYVVTKRVFGFDKDKNEKYVAKSVRSGKVNFAKMCRKVSQLCGVHRKVVDLVVSGLVDKMAEDIDDGKSVQLGEFGIFSPTIRAKSADDEKDVSSKSIVQRKIIFYPGKIFKDTLEDMSITRRVEIETDYTDGSSNGVIMAVILIPVMMVREITGKHRIRLHNLVSFVLKVFLE